MTHCLLMYKGFVSNSLRTPSCYLPPTSATIFHYRTSFTDLWFDLTTYRPQPNWYESKIGRQSLHSLSLSVRLAGFSLSKKSPSEDIASASPPDCSFLALSRGIRPEFRLREYRHSRSIAMRAAIVAKSILSCVFVRLSSCERRM